MHLAFIGSRSQVGLQAPAVAVEVHLMRRRLPPAAFMSSIRGLAESASRDSLLPAVGFGIEAVRDYHPLARVNSTAKGVSIT